MTTSRTKSYPGGQGKSPPSGTPTDSGRAMPRLTDMVIRLREWGSHELYKLPMEEKEITIGSAPSCRIRIDAKHVSKLHASLRREGARWILRDLASHNGTRLGGWPETEVPISPGSEIAIGRTTLVAESMRSIALRTFLGRVLGWSDAHLEAVDLALRAVRTAAARVAPLALYGDDDLVSIAYDIHRLAFTDTRPFIVCDPTRSTNERIRRGVRVVASTAEALAAASGGSLCVLAMPKRRPASLDELHAALTQPGAAAQLVIGGRNLRAVRSYGVTPIAIPPLHGRDDELEQIVRGYGDDARASLQTSLRLSPKDREWVRAHGRSFGEIQKCTERLLAFKHFGNYRHAADWLEMTAQGLSDWLEARDIIGVPA